jgi:hypothetical protein
VHADGRVLVFLRLQGLRCSVASEARRLLRVLLVRHSQVPADTVGGTVLHVPIRITVLRVPPGVTFARQRGWEMADPDVQRLR